jgi:hypothetical protein
MRTPCCIPQPNLPKGNAHDPRRQRPAEEPELVRKAIELAKAGDVQMLKFLLDRVLPKDRLIKIDIPQLDFSDEAIDGNGGNQPRDH